MQFCCLSLRHLYQIALEIMLLPIIIICNNKKNKTLFIDLKKIDYLQIQEYEY